MTERHVSVVLPVHNVGRYLDRCLDSLLRQSIGFDAIEVIAVDDGSTDGSGEALDRFAAGRDNVTVLHQANSGGPGGPRNTGMDASRGDYVFFVDPDDYLGVEAIERMYRLACRNDSDVVLGKMVGVGRRVPSAPFRRHLEHGDLYSSNAIWSLHSMKLFRRALVVEHGVRFLEGVRLGEDQEFVVASYLKARTFSVVADYDCYYLVRRDDGQNAVYAPVDPMALYAIVRRVIEMVVAHTEPGPNRNRLLARSFRVEVLGKAANRYFLDWDPAVREAFVRPAGALVEDHLPDELLAQLPAVDRLRAYFLRHRMPDELAEVVRFDVSGASPVPVVRDGRLYGTFPYFGDERYDIPDHYFDVTRELDPRSCREHVSWDGSTLRVSWEPLTPLLRGGDVRWSAVLSERDSPREHVVPGQSGPSGWAAEIDLAALADEHEPRTRRWDVLTQVSLHGVQRRRPVGRHGTLAGPPELPPGAARTSTATPYLTPSGRLAVASAPRRAGRVRCQADDLAWGPEGARLLVRGHLRLQTPGWEPVTGVTVLLAARESGTCLEAPAACRAGPDQDARWSTPPLAPSPCWQFTAALDADALARLPAALWDLTLRVQSGSLVLEGRLAADPDRVALPRPVIASGRPVVPYATVRGNLTLDVGDVRSRLTAAAHLDQVGWDSQEPRLHLRGRGSSPDVDGDGEWETDLVLRTDGGGEVAAPLTLARSPCAGDFEVDVEMGALLALAGRRSCRWRAFVRFRLAGYERHEPLRAPPHGAAGGLGAHLWRQGRWHVYWARPRWVGPRRALMIEVARPWSACLLRSLARGLRDRLVASY